MLSLFFIVIVLPCTLTTRVELNTNDVIARVQPFFLSSALDCSLLELNPKWGKFDFSSKKIRALLAGLSPSLLRLGGSGADWTIFAETDETRVQTNASGVQPVPDIFSMKDLDDIVAMTRATGTRFLMDLDIQLRFGIQWDPTNAIALMKYMEKKNYGENIDFELGNEPAANSKFEVQFHPDQVGKDFQSLIKVIRSFPNLKHSQIVGPDNIGTRPGSKGLEIFQSVINHTGPGLTAATFHQYNFRGDLANETDYVNPKYFQILQGTIDSIKKAVAHSIYPNTALWIGETADAWHGGTENVSDRFASGFLWMEKLGLTAREGISVVIRQVLYGHNYGLLNVDTDPNPDYWLSLLHKRLVGTRVLNVTYLIVHNTTRVYAHCSKLSTEQHMGAPLPAGSVTMFALNVHQTESDTIFVKPGSVQGEKVLSFTMRPMDNDVLSKYVMVNGQVLKMINDVTLPSVRAVTSDLTSGITLPPLSYGFFVLPEANATACL